MKKILTIDKVILQITFNQQLEQFNSNYILNKYRLKGNSFVVNSEIQLVKSQRLEKYYLNTYIIYYKDSQVATISTDCRQHGQRDSIKLQLNNYLFYTTPGWYHYYEKIIQALDMRFTSISLLEIACDFEDENELLHRTNTIYKNSSLLENNKPEEIIYKPLDGKLHGESVRKTFYFGSGSGKNGSGKRIKVYDKTNEIKDENNEKQYILDYYKANIFDISKQVTRIEAELSAKYLSKFLITACDLTEASFLEQLFIAAVANTFKFRKVDSKYFDKNRNSKTEIITLVEFTNLNSQPLYIKPISNNISEKEMSKRGAVKYTVQQYIKTGSPQSKEFLQLHIASIAAPKATKWPNLLAKYAKEYEGRVTDEIEKRINEFK